MSTQAPAPRAGILKIDAYVPGTSTLPGSGPVIKLSSNETPLGASPAAIAAARAAMGGVDRYPDGTSGALRLAIAERHGLNADRIVCGAGSDELLSLLAEVFIGPGDEGIYTEHGFLVYRIAILAAGGTPVVAPEIKRTADVDAILKAVSPRTKAVFLANPNNPTGTYLPFDEVRRLREGLPGSVLLVLDAAYAEYVRRNDFEAGIELVATTVNTVMTRTFSKIYGLAGLRIGWAYCPSAIADALNRIRGPFNLSGPAIAAGVAALADTGHVEEAVAHNEKWLGWLASEIGKLGLEVTPSVANFLLVHFSMEKGRTALDADEALQRSRILLRRVSAYGFPDALRLTVGTEAENRAVVEALAAFTGGGKVR